LAHTVPLTACPGVGVVSATVSEPVEPLATVTDRAAPAVRPPPSVTLRLSVWAPLAYPVVSHVNEAVVPGPLWLRTAAPSILKVKL
jgi:hypothetical protein